jgi:hypothetical protein
MQEESWRRDHGGAIMREVSWDRDLGGGMEEGSWRRNQARGFIERESGGLWRSLEASGALWRSLGAQIEIESGGLWRSLEVSGGLWRSLEASGALWRPLGAQRHSGGKVCQNHCAFLHKVARATISPAREHRDHHQVARWRTKTGGHRQRRSASSRSPAPKE